MVRSVREPEGKVTIAVVGKYTVLLDAYKSLSEALTHGGFGSNVKVGLEWMDSEIFERDDAVSHLENVHGILVPGGFGERGTEGKIHAVKFARERKVPFFGICFGMQMAVIEAARNLLGIEDASSSEFGPTEHAVVGLMTEWIKGNQLEKRAANGDLGGTMRLGAYPAHLRRGHQGARDLRPGRDQRAPSPSLRGQRQLQGPAGAGRPALLRHVARRHPAGDRRDSRPSLVHRRAVPSRAEVAAVRAASALHLVHRRGQGAKPAGLTVV